MIIDIPQYEGIGVYKITHSVNGKIYIGSALNCNARLREHSLHPQNIKMLEDSEKGVFTAEIVKAFPEGCTNRELMEAERYYSKLFATTTERGYNDPFQIIGHNARRGGIDDFVYSLRIPKKKRQMLKALANDRGESIREYINRAIDETIERDNSNK